KRSPPRGSEIAIAPRGLACRAIAARPEVRRDDGPQRESPAARHRRPDDDHNSRPILDAGAWQRRKCTNAPGLMPNQEGIRIVSKASLPLSRFTVLDL